MCPEYQVRMDEVCTVTLSKAGEGLFLFIFKFQRRAGEG